ncbi:MAG TPA: glycosyltransferase family 2 protein, partial [Candidatus Methylomirabilis sp.]|nr:glycosyltransferase family 2 protein [Candidatus Methylomirabilis sp.]
MKTSIVIPAYNEEAGLPVVLEKLFRSIDGSYEVIVVDDGSADATRDVALRFPCRVICHSGNLGKAAAMKTGIRAARGENLIFVDADDTYPVTSVTRISESLSRYDMVSTCRAVQRNSMSRSHRLGNGLFRWMICHLYSFRARDPLTGFYGIKKAKLEQMRLDSHGFGVETEICIKAGRMGLRVLEITIDYGERVGEAKLNTLRDGYQILQTIVKMVALYNPTVSFILPGGVLFAGAISLMVALGVGPFSIGSVEFGTNSFTLAALLALAAFHVAVFGFALKLYGLAHKFTKPDILTGFMLRDNMARNFALSGLVLIAVGTALAAWLGPSWLEGDLGSETEVKRLVLTAFLPVFGLDIIVSAVFVSIFSKEV